MPGTVPDVVGETGIGVHGADPAHGAGRRAVFRHVHVVPGSGEPRRLVRVQHRNPDGRPVLEGASAQEAWVDDGVEDLHGEGVGAPALVVHRLEGTAEHGGLAG